MKVLYLHGLGSSGNSNTSTSLKALGLEVVSPDYRPQYCEESMERLSQLLHTERPEMVIGTSMGGFYALKLYERFGLPTLAVNPCHAPLSLLDKYRQQPAVDYATGEAIHFSEAMLRAFEEPFPADRPTDWSAALVVIGANDDLILPTGQQAFCRRMGIRFVMTDWGHRVEDAGLLLEQARALVNRA